MAKQLKSQPVAEPADEVKPIATSSEGEAPVIAFAPYTPNEQYEDNNYSPSLINKANSLANTIWAGEAGYAAAQMSRSIVVSEEGRQVEQKNASFFNRYEAIVAVNRIVGIRWSFRAEGSYINLQKITELLKKLKRLEKKVDWDEILDEELRERIISNVLLPSNLYGVYDQMHGYMFLNMHYLAQRAVINELLSSDDVTIIENILNYIPIIRRVIEDFTPLHDSAVNADRLLVPIVNKKVQPVYVSPAMEKQLLSDVCNVARFFNVALPNNVVHDLIPAIKYPSGSLESFNKLREASRHLRNTSMGFIQEQKPLSELLEAIIKLSESIQAHFGDVVNEIDACFAFLNRIAMPFDQFVEESKVRIENSDLPF